LNTPTAPGEAGVPPPSLPASSPVDDTPTPVLLGGGGVLPPVLDGAADGLAPLNPIDIAVDVSGAQLTANAPPRLTPATSHGAKLQRRGGATVPPVPWH